MHWYVVVSLCFCAANFVTSLALVGLSSYHLYDDERFVPVKESQDWFDVVVGLIPFSVFVMIVSLFSLWGVIQKNRKWAASVIALNAVCVGGCIFFVVIFSQQAHAEPIAEESLFNHTKIEIENLMDQGDDISLWIPTWLDHIQKESASCCGINTYKDWEELWPQARSMIPTSCCISPSNDTTVCPKDLARIPYPGTPAKFIKVEHGCGEEINEQIKHHIFETFKFAWILLVFVVFGEISYCLLYFLRYYCASGQYFQDNTMKINILNAGDGDNIDDSTMGMTKIGVSQYGSSTENTPGEVVIDPVTGNPVVSFNVISYDSNNKTNQSGSSSITSGIGPPGNLQQNQRNNIQSSDNIFGNRMSAAGFTYNKKSPQAGAGLSTMSTGDPVSSNSKPQRRAVFLVQDDNPNYFDEIDQITSGMASNTSFDDFGDLPSDQITRNQNMGIQKGLAGVTRKRRY